MNTAAMLIEECQARAISLAVDGESLVVEPAHAMTVDLAVRLRAMKAETLVALAPKPTMEPDAAVMHQIAGVDTRLREDGAPRLPCWWCRGLEFERDLVGHGWVCVRCHPPGDLRADVARRTVPSPTGTGGAP